MGGCKSDQVSLMQRFVVWGPYLMAKVETGYGMHFASITESASADLDSMESPRSSLGFAFC